MDVGRLRTLREIWLRGTMAAAADALRISSSAVSQQISQLQEEAGVRLIERRGRGVQFTPAGEMLIKHAERIVSVVEEAKSDLAEIKRVVAGDLQLAAFPSVTVPLLPAAICALKCLHSGLRITLHQMEPIEGLAALRAWQVDAALVDDIALDHDPHHSNIETIRLMEDLLYVMLPSSHALATKEVISIGELSRERWALDTTSDVYCDFIVSKCRASGFEPDIAGRCSFEIVRALVEAAGAVSVEPGLRRLPYVGNAVFRQLVPEVHRTIFLAIRRSERRKPTILALVHQLQTSVSELDRTAQTRIKAVSREVM